MNNFKELERQQVQSFEDKDTNIKKSLDNSISTFSFLGSVIELYFSRMFGVMLNLTSKDQTIGQKSSEEDDIDLNALLK